MASMKLCLIILLAFLGTYSCYVVRKEYHPPFFCKKNECPKFKEDFNSSDYEIRTYEPSKWVSTTITGFDYSTAVEEGFMRLFDYIEGENEGAKKIPMTVPVINSIQPGSGPVCANNFTISFFVPFEFQKNTPKPTNKELFFSELPQQKVYVRVYPGFTTQKLFLEEAQDLTKFLNSSQTYKKNLYYVAGYDSPLHLQDRHNEIWFVATN